MSSSCYRGSWRATVARAALSMAGAHCGRPLAAVADLTAALWSSRGGSAAREGSGMLAVSGEGPERVRGGGSETWRLSARVQNVCSGHAQSKPTRCSAKCQCVLESSNAAGSKQA